MISTSGLHMDQAPPLSIPMRFFATAPLFMGLAGGVLVGWSADLFVSPLVAKTVALVHLAVLGWISMTMMGAQYQMIPVLVGRPVPWPHLSPWVHALLVLGVLGLFLGVWGELVWLWVAMPCLFLAVGMFVVQIAGALWRAPSRHPTVWAMGISTLALLATLTLGLLFLGEYLWGFLPMDRFVWVGLHMTWGLLGWVSVLIVGVSFQVLPMFYMMPAFPEKYGLRILWGFVLTLLLIPLALLSLPEIPQMLWLSGLPGVWAMGIYGWQIQRLMRARRRKIKDATLRFWKLGFSCAILAVVLLLVWPVQFEEEWRFVFGILFLLGWITSIILGMLYKIVPFLVWFHRFSRLAGLAQIPMMDDLISKRVANGHFYLHGWTIYFMCGTLLTDWRWLGIPAGVCLASSAGVLVYTLWFALKQHPPEVSHP
ncbi:MAG: hypothetical protein H7832_11025 [Magnetococcus sp. DMHC-6]